MRWHKHIKQQHLRLLIKRRKSIFLIRSGCILEKLVNFFYNVALLTKLEDIKKIFKNVAIFYCHAAGYLRAYLRYTPLG